MQRAILDGRFELIARVGSGGMGTIWRAIDLETREPVAVKIVTVRGAAVAERFARERRLLAGVRHPAIVRFVAGGTAQADKQYLVMEWIDGIDLESHLQERAFTVAEVCLIASRIAGALKTLHGAEIVHRDVKPANIMLPRGESAQAMLVDFGLARQTHSELSVTSPGGILGTPNYMAPERVRSEATGPAMAVFPLGCILYECVCGKKT